MIRIVVLFIASASALAGCVTGRPNGGASGSSMSAAARLTLPLESWDGRLAALQQTSEWQMDGRAAVVTGMDGWQASLDWQQHGAVADVRLAGPFGAGAVLIHRTAAGLSVNGAPSSDADLAQFQSRLGFALPVDELRYWLLGVPDPGGDFELTRNTQDRALHLSQAGWNVDYDRYMSVKGDLLPARLVLTHAGVRVRIVVDHWRDLP